VSVFHNINNYMVTQILNCTFFFFFFWVDDNDPFHFIIYDYDLSLKLAVNTKFFKVSSKSIWKIFLKINV
jgi:hypothetical protein